MRKLVVLPILALACLPLQAQEYQLDCGASEGHRQFDFWLGQWQVSDAEGKTLGSNHIESVQQGCALREQWQSASGGSGESLNLYRPASGRWQQLWVDGGASIIDLEGGLDDAGNMVMAGQIYYLKQGKAYPFRGSWSPLPDGRVRQAFEQQDAEGQWQPWFEGFYSRSGD